MSWAELRDLVVALPPDSATKAALAGDTDGRRWSQGDYALAAVYNALLLLVRVQWAAHLKGKPPEMAPMEPPRLEEDEEAAEERARVDARNRAVLDALGPPGARRAKAAGSDEVRMWRQRIAELQARKK